MNPRLGQIDALIAAADPDELVTPYLACINTDANQKEDLWSQALIDRRKEFYAAALQTAENCGSQPLHLLISPGGYKFIKA